MAEENIDIKILDNPNAKEEYKFKVVVVRGVDELGQPKGYPEGHLKYPDTV